MSDIHTVGLDLFSFSNNGMRKPVSRITLYVNNEDDQVYTAGDDTGLELSATCIYATEEMAKTLLSMAKGAQYQMYEAQAANLDPAAELGDGIEVGGITSVIAQINDNGDGYPDVSASGEQEVEDEYPGASRQGPIQRELARARSLIAKTNDMISLEIYGEDGKGGLNGRMNTFTMSLSGISGQITGYQETLTGYQKQLAEYKLDLDGFSADVERYSAAVEGYDSAVTEYTKEVGSYKLAVDGFSGEVSKYTETVNGYTEQVNSYKGTVEGYERTVAQYSKDVEGYKSEYSTISQTFKGIKLEATNDDGTVSIQLKSGDTNLGTPGTIDMTGLVTFSALKNGPDEDKGQTVINGGWLAGVRLQGNTILGGTYTNLNEDTWFGLGENGGKWGFRLANTDNEEKGIFGVYNGDGGYTSLSGKSGYTFLMTDGSVQTSYPQGTWDFSKANLITKGEVGFVPVFQ